MGMNEQEIKILNFIKNRGSFEKPVPRKRLEAEFSLNKRQLKSLSRTYARSTSSRLLQVKKRETADITCLETTMSEASD